MTSQANNSPKPHRAVTIISFGIVGWLCIPFGVLAWWLGHQDLNEMAAGTMDESGRHMTHIGVILGIIATFYFFGYLCFIGILWLFY